MIIARNRVIIPAVLLLQLSAASLAAQSADRVSLLRAADFGGRALFVAPHAAVDVGPVRVLGELEMGWGQAQAREGSAALAARMPLGFRLMGHFSASSATDASQQSSGHAVGFTLAHGRSALTMLRRNSQANATDYASDLDGFDIKLGVPLGTPLDVQVGLAARSLDVRERVSTVLVRDIVVAGYNFESVRNIDYLAANQHRDFEFDVSFKLGFARLGGLVGHGMSDGNAASRSWAYGRIAAPIARRIEIVGEAGRNGGVPAIGRLPQKFARLGFRVNLLDDNPDVLDETKSARVNAAHATIEVEQSELRLAIIANHANAVEIKGDFTGWTAIPMRRLDNNRWYVPVPDGVVHFNIRLDDREWIVPAGVPAIGDEFTGALVAVMVVRRPD